MVSTKLLIVSMVDLRFGLFFFVSLPHRFSRPEDWLYENRKKKKKKS